MPYITSCFRSFPSIFFFVVFKSSWKLDQCFVPYLVRFFEAHIHEMLVVAHHDHSTFVRINRLGKRILVSISRWFVGSSRIKGLVSSIEPSQGPAATFGRHSGWQWIGRHTSGNAKPAKVEPEPFPPLHPGESIVGSTHLLKERQPKVKDSVWCCENTPMRNRGFVRQYHAWACCSRRWRLKGCSCRRHLALRGQCGSRSNQENQHLKDISVLSE